jgi:hypothetical protein
MSQSIKHPLSGRDFQLIESNQLGIPLAIYELKPYMTLLYRCGLMLVVLGVVILGFLFVINVTGWYKALGG